MPSACGPTQTQSHMQYRSFIVKANIHLLYATTMQTPSLKAKNFRTFLLRQMEKRIKRENMERKKKIQDKCADLPPRKMEKFHHCECWRKRNVLFFPICVRQGLKSRANRRVMPRKLGAGVYLKTGVCMCVHGVSSTGSECF